jgi:hypothetical protein
MSKTIRNGLIASTVGALALMLLPIGDAEAKRYRSYKSKSASQNAEFERNRANSFDPAGRFKGYPDWARYALSPKW